ncbi:MAG: tol-pal system protein YbgF [Hyphomonadaceae bacterium]
MVRALMIRVVRTAAPAFAALSLSAAAHAQTVLAPAPPDPAVNVLQDRVDMLEAELRRVTGENEQLQFALRKAQDENILLKRTIDDLNGNSPTPPPVPSAAASGVTVDADPKVAYAKAYAFIQSADHRGAVDAFTAFLQAYPNAPQAPDARYNLGQALLVLGQPAEAASQFLAILQNAPKAAAAASAMVRLGVALNRMGQKKEACSTLGAVSQKYPKAAPTVKTAAANQIKAIGCPA